MSMIARALVAGLLLAAGSGTSFAEQRGAELAPVATWAGKSQQKAIIDGRLARALGLSTDGKPLSMVAVTTPYLDGSRSVYMAPGNQLLFSQGKDRSGTWMLTNSSGALVRAVEWVPTSANPVPADAAKVGPLFTETKAFWKAQLGKPVR
jgi:hypothetical protein